MNTCYFCSETYDRGINACHWTGSEYIRVHVCSETACRDQIAEAPRAPRRPRRQPSVDTVSGGWSAAALFGTKVR
jgi:hypothetical protein